MDNGSARKDVMDVEGDDRLSSLPDDVIHKILSFISIKDAIGVGVLSSRWRFIWTTMPYLNFENLNPRGPSISEFISNVLSHHNTRIQVSSLNLVLGRTVIDDESVTRILNCAYSHNVQQLTVTRSPGKIVGRPLISTPTGFPSLEKVDLCMYNPSNADADKIVSLLQHFSTAKLLILSLGILQRLFQQRKHLSAFTKLIPHQACVFANAKILKFITKLPVKVYLEVRSEIKNCDTCPSAIFPMVSDEEIKAIRDMASAQLFVKNLGLFLKECKANKNSNMKEPQVKKHWAWELQMNLWEIMARIKQSKSVAFETCLIMEKFRPSSSKALQIIAWLQENRSLFQCIEKLMTSNGGC
ncbi:hypothetical protein L2E82_43514 [Cichorium intybus]|uniref:Uncharacterized protein n=1 Tax=Cichorium intybus TaxID=13427 RepID=A0ACB8ZNP6_CICIN|nr:hypothetical protein L2E82_43514 [Cichorium intybus]